MIAKQKGFTLLEITIVVAILILIAVAILLIIDPRAQILKAFDSRRKADLQKIKIALEGYYSDHGCYPVFPQKDSQNRPTYTCGSDILKPYLDSMPCDPNTNEPYVITLIPNTGSCPQEYAFYANILSSADDSAQKIPQCPNTYAVSSPNLTDVNLINGCSLSGICTTIYGCRKGACVVVAEGELSPCERYSYCENDCNGLCSNSKYDCDNPR